MVANSCRGFLSGGKRSGWFSMTRSRYALRICSRVASAGTPRTSLKYVSLIERTGLRSTRTLRLVVVATLIRLDEGVLDREQLDLDAARRLLFLHHSCLEHRVHASEASVDEKQLVELLVHESRQLLLGCRGETMEGGAAAGGESREKAGLLPDLGDEFGEVDRFRLRGPHARLRVLDLVLTVVRLCGGRGSQETLQPSASGSSGFGEKLLVLLQHGDRRGEILARPAEEPHRVHQDGAPVGGLGGAGLFRGGDREGREDLRLALLRVLRKLLVRHFLGEGGIPRSARHPVGESTADASQHLLAPCVALPGAFRQPGQYDPADLRFPGLPAIGDE